MCYEGPHSKSYVKGATAVAMIEVKKEFSETERMLFGPLFALFAGLITRQY